MHPLPAFHPKETPFLKLLLPFLAGILTQFYSGLSAFPGLALACISLLALICFPLLHLRLQWRFQLVRTISLLLLLLAFGSLLTIYKDPTYHPQWIGHQIIPDSPQTLIATIQEPPSARARSWKTTAAVQGIFNNQHLSRARGKILLYLPKDSSSSRLQYGDILLFSRALQPVQKSGNPGAFNYQRYCALQGIHHQTFLPHGSFTLLNNHSIPWLIPNPFYQFLYRLQEKLLGILQKFIPGSKECGLAEALLIGYKDHLDKDLVQAYSNTGVIHVIAISGLHLGIIYWLLYSACKLFHRFKAIHLVRPLIIISGLWAFSLLAGASPSVLRSAVMFSGLALGEAISRRSTVYNSLAGSAFLLLCYNPFWLWDTGFQLSYAAVLSISIFYRPIYRCCYLKPYLLDQAWKLLAGTLAAQVLTLPILLFQFHQFPLLFLFSNLLAIPLSSLILLGEIALCLLAVFPIIAQPLGQGLHWVIRLLNSSIEWTNTLPINSIRQIPCTLTQAFLLYGILAALAAWLLFRKSSYLLPALALLLPFCFIDALNRYQHNRQQLMVIYQQPGRQAIDLFQGRQYVFHGDPLPGQEASLPDPGLEPSRNFFRVTAADSLASLHHVTRQSPLLFFGKHSLLIPDTAFCSLTQKEITQYPPSRFPIDLLLLSHNAPVRLDRLASLFRISQVVIDGSNSYRNSRRWQQDCQRLGIPCHYSPSQGAFVLNAY
ncbi:MAG: ComEC/Rec2 family competence protein [Candidatus Pseudobacter hemicellulosilyticus]|uniref:ComEC/Rec2 family competence protein n=1 Tax=Candidatus Pseudobacter hemicellulosilyticus TaxID=3121375 RepID=A0AAJ5WXE3_9BACT|nr:MAG: ComEC/Rec2 family competence protein [Pseudobacter sp.]